MGRVRLKPGRAKALVRIVGRDKVLCNVRPTIFHTLECGYLEDDDSVSLVYKKRILPFFILAISAIIFIFSIFSKVLIIGTNSQDVNNIDGLLIDGNHRGITFVDEKRPSRYEVYLDGQTIINDTGIYPAGQELEVILYGNAASGTHMLTVVTIYPDTGEVVRRSISVRIFD